MSNEPGLFEVLYTCRAMRRLKPDPVPRELLLKLIDAANQAPSGSNLQSARWIIVQDPAQKAKLAELNRKGVEAYVAPRPTSPPRFPTSRRAKRQRMLDAVLWQKDHMHELPALIVACYEFPTKVTGCGRGARRRLGMARRAEPAARGARAGSGRGADHARVDGPRRGRRGARPARHGGGLLPHSGGLADGELRSADSLAGRGNRAMGSVVAERR